MNGKWDEKWDNGSEYVVNIVTPPQLNWLHVPMQLGACHGSENQNGVWWGNFPNYS